MSIHNVTPTHFDHVCNAVHPYTGSTCGKSATREHAELEQVQGPDGSIILVAVCVDDPNHRECFNHRLTAADETAVSRDDFSREQVRNVRALYRHLGLPVKD